MKYIYVFTLFVSCLLISCSGQKETSDEGVLTYTIDYPESKDNIFLYHILPKELKTSFKKDKMELKIKKASTENTLIIDNNKKTIGAYFLYDEPFSTELNNGDIQLVLAQHPKYKIKFTNKTDTIAGFDVKQAIAIDPAHPNEEIEIWYTNDIKVKNSNWFNGFEKIPGVLLKYTIVQYGIKMEFKATNFQNVTISDSVVSMKRPGKKIPHSKYDKMIKNIFESFK